MTRSKRRSGRSSLVSIAHWPIFNFQSMPFYVNKSAVEGLFLEIAYSVMDEKDLKTAGCKDIQHGKKFAHQNTLWT